MADKNCENSDDDESLGHENTPAVEQGYKRVAELLEKCEIEHLVTSFVKEEVDDDFLFNLDLENAIEWSQVASLLPTIGSKGRFRKAVKNYQVSVVFISCES